MPRELVAVQRRRLREAQRQVAVAAQLLPEEQQWPGQFIGLRPNVPVLDLEDR